MARFGLAPRTCLLALLALLAPAASALDPATNIGDYAVRVWQGSAGLPQSHVRTIIQTRDGYIWIGTKGGLARFDGVRFTVFDDRPSDQLQEGEVWALQEDDDGALWIGTFGGGLIRYKDERFRVFTKQDGLASNFVSGLAQCKGSGGLWIGTDGSGIAFLKGGHFTPYTQADGLQSNEVKSLHCDGQGTLWIGTTKGISSYAEGRFSNTSLDLGGDGRVTSIVSDGGQGVWIGMLPHGLAHFVGGTLTRFAPGDGLVSDQVGGLLYDSRGTLWIATNQGLCRRQAERFSCSSLQANTEEVSTVALEGLQAPMQDREGNLWVGSVSGGLMRFKDSEFVNYGDAQGLLTGARVVLETREGTMWIAGAGGLTRLAGGRATSYGKREGLSNASIRNLFEDKDGALWIGTAVGLNVMRNGKIEQVKDAGLDQAFIYGVLRDQRGDLWIATGNAGLYHGRDGHYRVYTPADGLYGSQLRCLREDAKGDIWVGTRDGGLTRWHAGQFTRFGREQGLAGESVQSLYVDAENALWAGTRHGLSRVKDDHVTTFDARNGLPANLIYQMLQDDAGDMWFTCSRGIFRVPKQELAALVSGATQRVRGITYGPEAGTGGAVPVVTGYPSILKSRDGSLWFATERGLSILDPARRVGEARAFPVRIEEVLVDGQAHSLAGAPRAPFGPGSGRVEIHYTGLQLYAPEKMTFRYRLEGFDKQWTEAGTRRVAYYTNLPPGPYRFEVQATDFNGLQAEQPAAFEFSLRQHFYETRWFQALAAVCLVLLAFGTYRWRIASHERAAQELQRRVDEAVSDLNLLDGLLPICAWCKKVREDTGYWSQVEAYVSAHSRAQFSHGICPDCAKNVYSAHNSH